MFAPVQLDLRGQLVYDPRTIEVVQLDRSDRPAQASAEDAVAVPRPGTGRPGELTFLLLSTRTPTMAGFTG